MSLLGITQKNGHPAHPQIQGNIERFHQTLKRWLTHTGFKDRAEHRLADLEAGAMSTPEKYGNATISRCHEALLSANRHA